MITIPRPYSLKNKTYNENCIDDIEMHIIIHNLFADKSKRIAS